MFPLHMADWKSPLLRESIIFTPAPFSSLPAGQGMLLAVLASVNRPETQWFLFRTQLEFVSGACKSLSSFPVSHRGGINV